MLNSQVNVVINRQAVKASGKREKMKNKIYVCGNQRAGGAGCIQGGKAVLEALIAQASERPEEIEIVKGTCLGHCSEGPNVKIHGGRVFSEVQVADIADILDSLKPRRRRAG